MLPRLRKEAVEEAIEASKWYAEIDAVLADDFVQQVAVAFEAIDRSPRRFARLETVVSTREIRRVQLPRFPYLVVFEMFKDVPIVLAVMHTSRAPDYWLSRRPND